MASGSHETIVRYAVADAWALLSGLFGPLGFFLACLFSFRSFLLWIAYLCGIDLEYNEEELRSQVSIIRSLSRS